MRVKTSQFQANARTALADQQLQSALSRVMHHFDEARENAVQELTPAVWDELKERGRAIKRHTLDNLDYYLELLADRVTAAGGVVHFASTAAEARDIVVDLARKHSVRLVTKGKSMVSEEIGMNDALQREGIDVVETDLGEYIVQLAGEPPFHIIAPAMHKTKEQISQLFVEKRVSEGLDHTIEELAGAARRTLRPKFLRSDMGISGVNFAVADTGTIVIVTNEGNGQLCTSLPRIHVALMGMEKIVPALEDVATFLRLLPRAATGQRLTTYTTFITGPRRSDEEDGPDEFHLVILDNGRSRLLADPQLREALYCVRCGACLNVCPVYSKIGGHAYGWVYSGPIGSLVTPMIVGLPQAKALPFASTLCGACREVCPVKIDIPHLLLLLRRRLMEGPAPSDRQVSPWEKILVRLWSVVMRSERALALTHRLGVILQKPLVRRGRIGQRWLPLLSRWTQSRDLPPLAQESFHDRWRKRRRGGQL